MKCKFIVELSLSLWLPAELHGWALYMRWRLLVMTTTVTWPGPDSLRLSWPLDKRFPPQTHTHRALLPTSLYWSLAAWILSQDPFYTIHSLYPPLSQFFSYNKLGNKEKREEKKTLLWCSFGGGLHDILSYLQISNIDKE